MPVVTVFSLVLTVLAFLIAFYFYLNPRIPHPAPSYTVLPNRSSLVQGSSPTASGIGVTYNGKAVSGRDITAVTIYFWNDGPAPMKKEDILVPFKLVLPGNANILDIRVLGQSRPLCAVGVSGPEDERNTAILGFKILEKGDGAKIQLIYAGDPLAEIRLEGSMIGAAGPTSMYFVDRSKFRQQYPLRRDLDDFYLVILIVLALILSKLLLSLYIEKLEQERREVEGSFEAQDPNEERQTGDAIDLEWYSRTLKTVRRLQKLLRYSWIIVGCFVLLFAVKLCFESLIYINSNPVPQQLFQF